MVTSVADAKGNTTNYCHDGYGRFTETRFPSEAVPGVSTPCSSSPAGSLSASADFEAYHYDAAGNVTSGRLRDGQAITYQYDQQNRLKLKDVPDPDRDVTYLYDLLGRMTAANLPGANAAFSVAWSYDKLGVLVTGMHKVPLSNSLRSLKK